MGQLVFALGGPPEYTQVLHSGGGTTAATAALDFPQGFFEWRAGRPDMPSWRAPCLRIQATADDIPVLQLVDWQREASLQTEIVQVLGPKIPVESFPAPRCREPLIVEYRVACSQSGTLLVRFSGNTWPLQEFFASLHIDGEKTEGIYTRQTRPLQDGAAADEALLQDIHQVARKTCCRFHYAADLSEGMLSLIRRTK